VPPRAPLLDLPVREGVARIARRYLADAVAALDRLRNTRDTEALHDFRVAVRRLRSLLRAYRRWLGRASGKKVRRRFRDLGQATNPGRDAEVQIDWLETQRAALTRRERSGLNWLLRRLRSVKRDSYRAARKQVKAGLHRSEQLLRHRLDEPTGQGTARFRTAFAALLREQVAELETKLEAIAGADDEEQAHEARISAKRLRYLVEPVRYELPGGRRIVGRLKRLQDVLGKLHDIHVLAGSLATCVEKAAREKARRMHALALAGDDRMLGRERRRDERLGLVTLAARAHGDRDRLFAELDRGWLRGRARALFQELKTLADTLAEPATRDSEIERKFLLSALPPEASAAPAQEIEQGWLPGERLRERLRRVTDADGERFYRTVKLGSGIQRLELEEETSAELFAALWPHTAGCRVAKRRYKVRDGAFTWEIDAFRDRDLLLAEVELPDPDTAVTIPTWLAPHLVRDVTGDPAYLNINLAG
jgi:CHAD domain-containing protein/CYTH domain-containing protein